MATAECGPDGRWRFQGAGDLAKMCGEEGRCRLPEVENGVVERLGESPFVLLCHFDLVGAFITLTI